jgi:hypothetical protein
VVVRFMLLRWYAVDATSGSLSIHAELNALQAFRTTDIALLVLAFATGALGAVVALARLLRLGPRSVRLICLIAAGLAATIALVVLDKVLNPPFDAGLKAGPFLTIGAAICAAGASLVARSGAPRAAGPPVTPPRSPSSSG